MSVPLPLHLLGVNKVLARVRQRQRQATERQFASEAIKKAEESDLEKVETEEVETIGKKVTEVQPLEVKAVEDKLAETGPKTTFPIALGNCPVVSNVTPLAGKYVAMPDLRPCRTCL